MQYLKQQFDRVVLNQRRYGGTIQSAMVRANQQEQQPQRQQQAEEVVRVIPGEVAAVRPAPAREGIPTETVVSQWHQTEVL
jgi:hypothetical protein